MAHGDARLQGPLWPQPELPRQQGSPGLGSLGTLVPPWEARDRPPKETESPVTGGEAYRTAWLLMTEARKGDAGLLAIL